MPGSCLAQWKAARTLSHDDWIAFLAGLKADELPGLPAAPPLPDADFQAAFVGSSGFEAMREAGEFYRRAHAVLVRSGEPWIGKLLDFGCGWGRIYRVFLRDGQELVGVDIDEQCIATCQAAMPYGSFEVCGQEPPLSFMGGSFDVVVAYSVFSHLAEHAFRSWMHEFRRLLRPGSHVFFTTLKEAHLDVWDELSRTGNDYYKAALSAAAFSKRKWARTGRGGERILFVPTGGGDVRAASFYGEAIATRAYLQRVLPDLGFELVDFSDEDVLPQVFVAARLVSESSRKEAQPKQLRGRAPLEA